MGIATHEYRLTVDAPGRRWRVDHATPGAKDGEHKVYFVSMSRGQLSCSCPAGRYRGRCKHAAFVADLLGKPTLDPACPF